MTITAVKLQAIILLYTLYTSKKIRRKARSHDTRNLIPGMYDTTCQEPVDSAAEYRYNNIDCIQYVGNCCLRGDYLRYDSSMDAAVSGNALLRGMYFPETNFPIRDRDPRKNGGNSIVCILVREKKTAVQRQFTVLGCCSPAHCFLMRLDGGTSNLSQCQQQCTRV